MHTRVARDRAQDRRGESGQALILWVLAATVIFVIGVIVVDFGLWLTERRRAQTAADLAALAAVSVLDQGNAAAQAKALDFADRNGYTNGSNGVEVNVTPGFGGNSDEVEVTVKQGSQALFLGVIGRLDISIDIGARAVATRAIPPTPPPPPAILALDNSCAADALQITGSGVSVTGLTHSNSTATISGSANIFDGGFNYVCSPINDGGTNTYSPNHAPGSERVSPLGYSYGDFNCDHEFTSDADVRSEPSLWQGNDPNTNNLKQGVICSTGNLTLGGADVTGRVTLVAQGEIDIGGSNFSLTPNEKDVLLFSESTSSSALNVSASGGSWEGFFYAPDGKITVSGSAPANISAGIIGNQVTISGSNYQIDSSSLIDPSGGEPIPHLVD